MKDIAFHITDIAENCFRAGADEVRITIESDGPRLTLIIADNGCGMDEETIRRATNPFYTTRTTRKVGLGLPFLIQNAEQSGGSVSVESRVGEGTEVRALFMTDNIDCPPPGDLAGTITMLITGNPDVNTIFTVSAEGGGEFSVSTAELREIMGGMPLGLPRVSSMVREIIEENIGAILKIEI